MAINDIQIEYVLYIMHELTQNQNLQPDKIRGIPAAFIDVAQVAGNPHRPHAHMQVAVIYHYMGPFQPTNKIENPKKYQI